jgi:choline-sulfatase
VALALILLACARFPAPDDAPVPGEVCPDDRPQENVAAPRTVLILSMDTVNRDFLGLRHAEWDTTPTLDAISGEGVRFDDVIVPRGLSAPSIASLATGAYPRTHGVRDNVAPDDTDYTVTPYPDGLPTLYDRARDAGFTTWGLSANMCFLVDAPDRRTCMWEEEVDVTQEVGDAALAADFVAGLAELPAEAPLFAWVHFMDPHDPYKRRDPWYAEFHPDTYTGPYEDTSEKTLEAIAAGEPFDDEDRRHLEAVYASQLRATDEHVREIVEALQAAGRWDDAVVLVAFDHGDELARRSTYLYHGCSPYNGVVASTYSLRAPGSVAPGEVLAGWVPSIDVVATFAEVAGFGWEGPQEGLSLLDDVRACVEPEREAFFERGTETAGVVSGHHKYILDPEAGYTSCKHYDRGHPYPGEPAELYDLDADALEVNNLADDDPATAAELKRSVCAWVTAGVWAGDNDQQNSLVRACR